MADTEQLNKEISEARSLIAETSSQITKINSEISGQNQMFRSISSEIAKYRSNIIGASAQIALSVGEFINTRNVQRQLTQVTEKKLEIARQELLIAQKQLELQRDREKKLEDLRNSTPAPNSELQGLADAAKASTDADAMKKLIEEYNEKQKKLNKPEIAISNNSTLKDMQTLVADEFAKEVAKNREETKKKIDEYNKNVTGASRISVTSDMTPEQLQKAIADKWQSAVNETARLELERKKKETDVTVAEEENRKQKIKEAFEPWINSLKAATDALNNFTNIVREGQQRFGLDAGRALLLEYKNAFASIDSYARAIMSGGANAGVSIQEIRGAQQSMQAEFGGAISSRDAAELARQAKEMGVATQQLAQARRIFMTTTMGDMGRAAAEQDRFVTAFQQKGLTSKDAMEAIGKNSELLARAGTRFADSFAKAAVESKKIGVELSKVNQVGDNIIGNFESFLESQAELGAMGFGFDTSRLAEIAESGDTNALMEELRSQLAMTGKDLGSLRRSEQLALSSAFGMNIGELQRMAGPTPEVAEQQKSNRFLERMVNVFDGLGKVFGVITSLLSIISVNTSKFRLSGRTGAGGATRAIPPGRLARAGRLIKAGGITAGVIGGAQGFIEARRQKQTRTDAAGAAVTRGGAALGGAMLGGALGSYIPVLGTAIGAVIGGVLGDVIGKALNKYVPGISASIGAIFRGFIEPLKNIKNIFAPIKPVIDMLKDSFSQLFGMFSVEGKAIGETTKQLLPKLVDFGKVLAGPIIAGFTLVSIVLQLLLGTITFFVDSTRLIVALLQGDLGAVKEIGKVLLANIGNLFKSIGNTILEAIKDSKLGRLFLRGTESRTTEAATPTSTADDMISRPGYGQRRLVTPTGVIALNNQDNIVAYADDMISQNAGVELLSKGEIARDMSKVTVDLTALEKKLDQMIVAIGNMRDVSMDVVMDADKVGRAIVRSSERSMQSAIFRPMDV
jgi:hypothetical protein